MPINPSQNSMNFRLATGTNPPKPDAKPDANAKPRTTLVAGSVKPVPFVGAEPASKPAAVPAPTGDALPLYRHPADKNAAATAVHAGRVIDVRA
ncbi:MAG: hypothetical protein AABZ53_00790 [Planctomycetota bacterium]